jgi:hypothetical protein
MACVSINIGRARPGTQIRVTARLGRDSATLLATAGRQVPYPGSGQTDLERGPVIIMRNAKDSTRVSVPRQTEPIGSRQHHGPLCLVRFQPRQSPVAVLGTHEWLMGGLVKLTVVASGSRTTQMADVEARPWPLTSALGQPLVISGDSRFDGVTGWQALDALPLRVLTVEHRKLVDVTRHYPQKLRTDADRQWRSFLRGHHHPRGDALGAVAAWAADECKLGNQEYAFSTLDRLAAQHRLENRGATHQNRKFVRHIKQFLTHTGYAAPGT